MAVESGSVRRESVPAVLLERDAELALLAGLVRDVAARRGGLVMFEAPAGLGKSVLLEHGVRMAHEASLLVLRARGHQLEQAFAWGVARSLFEGLLHRSGPDPARLLDGPAAPARQVFEDGVTAGPATPDAGFSIMHGMYWLTLRLAQREPLLLVVDDAHWADEPSLRFLVYLIGRVSDAPIGALVAVRSPEAEAQGLVGLLADDPAARVRRLRPLGSAAVGELVQRRLAGAAEDFCRRCHALTAGNPLFLRELLVALEERQEPLEEASVDAGAAAAARSLERSVLRRLDTMTPPARALAVAVAVFEDDVRLHLAAALASVGPAAAVAAADELARADVLRRGDPLSFVHPLVRAAIYGSLPDGVRADTHMKAARLLADAGATIEQVCGHLLEAPATGDESVVDSLRAAARRALAQGVPASAVRYLERACREPPSPEAQPGVLAELGHAEAIAGRPEALPHLEAAIALADHAEGRARLLLEFGRAQHHVGRLHDACTTFRRGLAELERAGIHDTELSVELEGGYLNAAMFGSDHVADAHHRAVDILRGADGLTSHAELALLSKAVVMRLWAGGRREEILAATRRLLSEGRLTEDDAADSQVAWQAIATLGWCDDYAAADGAIRVGLADARRRGSVLSFALACIFRSRHGLWTGPVDEAVHDARSALEVLPPDSVYVSSAAYCLVSGLVEQGDRAEAERVLDLGDRRPALPPFFAAWWWMAQGRCAVARGDDEQAVEAFLATGRHHDALRIANPTVLPWRSEAGLAARRLGRLDLAAGLIDEEVTLAERFGTPRAVGVARRAAGLLARGDAAVDLLRSAVEVLAGARVRVEQVRALADLGAATRRAGRPAEARRILRKALGLAEQVGASAVAGHAREELRAAGGRPHSRARGPADGLTPGERRVAELAAAGQSNRQIANALFITVKAVEWHLGNAYRKLGVHGREELSDTLAQAPRA